MKVTLSYQYRAEIETLYGDMPQYSFVCPTTNREIRIKHGQYLELEYITPEELAEIKRQSKLCAPINRLRIVSVKED